MKRIASVFTTRNHPLAFLQKQKHKALSKYLSLVLRHNPSVIGVELDPSGWAVVDELLDAFGRTGTLLSYETLVKIVQNDSKNRFAMNPEGTKIRANQGHSLDVDLRHPARVPPAKLFHGTYAAALDSIRRQGLCKMDRLSVHLSEDSVVARAVGARRGAPCVLSIAAEEMSRDGFAFTISDNGVWLTAHVPLDYIEFPSR